MSALEHEPMAARVVVALLALLRAGQQPGSRSGYLEKQGRVSNAETIAEADGWVSYRVDVDIDQAGSDGHYPREGRINCLG